MVFRFCDCPRRADAYNVTKGQDALAYAACPAAPAPELPVFEPPPPPAGAVPAVALLVLLFPAPPAPPKREEPPALGEKPKVTSMKL